MEIMTKYFGTLSFQDDEILYFEDGLFGFEEYKKFGLIRFDNENGNILCLQSMENSELAFPVLNPFAFLKEYRPCLSEEELKKLDLHTSEEALFYNICVIRPALETSTVNLRCPIVINPETRKSAQIILDNREYSFKYPFEIMMKGD